MSEIDTSSQVNIAAKYIYVEVASTPEERSLEDQFYVVSKLNGVVSKVLEKHQIGEESRVLLPTGEGLCIVLINIQIPVDIDLLLALSLIDELFEVNKATSELSKKIEVRIGINQSDDCIIKDINDNQNVVGAGVGMAKRLMYKAEGSQILVSGAVYERLKRWKRYVSSFRVFESVTLVAGSHAVVYQYVDRNHYFLNCESPKGVYSV